MMKLLKWFYPGMKIKRWIILTVFGVIMLSMGFVIIISEEEGTPSLGSSVLVIIGVLALITGVKRIINSLIQIFMPNTQKELVDIVYKKRALEKGPRIVTIGGGEGLCVMLHGLKEYTNNLTAMLTVVDEAHFASGIQDKYNIPQPSDIRDCLISLADSEPVVGNLFHYRFKKGTELWGHNFGDLFLTAMSQITGDFNKAVKESSKVLAVRGQVILSTLSKLSLIAQHKDGTETVGKHDILSSASPIKRVYLRPQLAQATQEAINSILNAELIILGPGSLYTGIMPGLLINGVREALLTSKALKVYIVNMLTKPGETDDYKASDHLRVINEHIGKNIIDYCIVNKDSISEEQLKKYEQEGAVKVLVDKDELHKLGCRVVEDSIVDTAATVIRHDSQKLAGIIFDLLMGSRKVKGHGNK